MHHNPEINEWWRTIYNVYADRFLSDNRAIWHVGSISIPLSLSAFGVLSQMSPLQFHHVVLLGLPSVLILGFWYLAAERHRQFQDRSFDVLETIECRLGVRFKEVEKTRIPRVQAVRRLLFITVLLAWILVGLGVEFGGLDAVTGAPK